ncbi:uncharacterized protein MONOS_16927 [Monocercomonoides exilis]|uniref:uncharacterized protein n=1 Tax=Monocercomonoides exilis TaxID=2049356 RepID=UPI003559D15D|nr:hypothetical protein MONOS_16927 [Monocercomonoides exilis]
MEVVSESQCSETNELFITKDSQCLSPGDKINSTCIETTTRLHGTYEHAPIFEFQNENFQSKENELLQCSKAYPSTRFIISASNDICLLFSKALQHLLTTSKKESSKTSEKFSSLSSSGVLVRDKAKHLLLFVSRIAPITIGEIVHSLILLERFIQSDIDAVDNTFPSIVTEENMGTILLCSLITSIKMNRDITFRNKWWANLFDIPLEIINQSEIIFLAKLRFDLMICPDEFLKMFYAIYQCGCA